MTQIANLLLLAPKIQKAVLDLRSTANSQDAFTEHGLREIVSLTNWVEQRISWWEIETLSRPPAAACGTYAAP